MKTIAQVVSTIISQKLFLAELLLLAEGLINISPLARKIKPKIEGSKRCCCDGLETIYSPG